MFECGLAMLSRHKKVRTMMLWVEIKTNCRFGVLVLGVLQVAAVSGEKMAEKEAGWRERVMM